MMKAPPAVIGDASTLYYISLDTNFKRTGKTTHYVGGQMISTFSALAICQYLNDNGYYLFYCNEDWTAIADTYHDSIEDAMDQAAFEYEALTPEKWKQFQ